MAKLDEIGLQRLIENIDKNINVKINNIKDTLADNVSYVKEVTVDEWQLIEGTYKTTLNHPLKTQRLAVTAVDSITKDRVFIHDKAINDSTVELEITTPKDITVLIINGSSEIKAFEPPIDDNNNSNMTSWSGNKSQQEIDNVKSIITQNTDNINNIQSMVAQNTTNIDHIQSEFNRPENTKYTTVNGIKEFECGNGYVDNVVIEGQTLVNLANNVKVNALTETSGNLWDNGATSTCIKNGSEYTCTTSGAWEDFGSIISVKPNTTYTFFADITGIIDNDVTLIVAEFSQQPVLNTSNGNASSYLGVTKDPNPYGNKRAFKITTKSTTQYCAFLVTVRSANTTYKFRDFMVLEGDYTQSSLNYFEGLKSVGQGDKIEVLTRNENGNIFDDELEIGSLDDSGNLRTSSNAVRTKNYINVIPNTTLVLSNDKSYGKNVYYYDKGKNFLQWHGGTADGIINIPSNCYYIKFRSNEGSVQNDLSVKYQLEYGQTPTSYQKPQYDKKQILTTCRSLPNGVKDVIYKQGEKYYKIKRCEEYVYNGEDFQWVGTTAEGTAQVNIYKSDVKAGNNIYCNLVCANGPANIANQETVFASFTSGGLICVRLLNTKLSATDKEANKKYLLDNNLTVVYELATPVIEELPNFNPRTFDNKTTILLNSGAVQAEASFEVTNSTRSELEALKGKVSDLDNTVININNSIEEEVCYPTLLNGWVTHSADYTPCFIKNSNIVTFNLRIKSGVWSSGTILLYVPEQFRIKYGYASVFPAIDLANDKTYNAIMYKEGFLKLFGVDAEPTGGLAIGGSYYVG